MVSNNLSSGRRYSSADIKEICRKAGADDAGLVDIDREALHGEREGILRVYPRTKSIISLIKAHNRENIQSPARYIANEEYHHTGDSIPAFPERFSTA